jgi:hypothetical protein
MALLFMDGWDKYGGVNSNGTSVQALLQQEWTVATTGTAIVAGLSATGLALQCTSNGSGCTKTLSANYGRIIGGVRFNSTLTTNPSGVQFLDAGSSQCGIGIAATGIISLRNGTYNAGTILGSGATAISANSTHYLEWDITLGNSAAYNVYLDGVSIISGTGDTTATTNNTINGVQFTQGSAATITWDDFYLFDSTGTTNNAVLLTSPRIETTFPNADSAVQFAVGAATLGNSVSRNAANLNLAANTLYLRPYTPSRNCTLNSITLLPNATSGTLNLRPVIYADNAGSPNGGALLSAGSTVTGATSGTPITLPLTTPQSLTAGTQYWLGFMNDVAFNGVAGADGGASGRSAVSTFSSGAPGTCPTLATGSVTGVVYGNITLASPVNWYEVASQPPQGLPSYVFDATVTHEDLFTFPALSATPAVIYAVATKANIAKSDAGAKTVTVRTKSSTTDAGSSAVAPATTFGWITHLTETDPATSAAWTPTALNNAQGGYRVES